MISLIKERLNFVYVHKISDQSHLSKDEFFLWLKNHGYIYLKDHHGKQIPAEAIPTEFTDLKNDPFRSLAGAVEKQRAFKKTILYSENIWADFFRKYLSSYYVENFFDSAVETAIELAHSEQASQMPGFKSHRQSPLVCDGIFNF